MEHNIESMSASTVDRRTFLKTGMGAAIGSAMACGGGQKAQPDVLFIAIEDLSPHRLPSYGNSICQSPNLDRFFSQGIRFEKAYCAIAPCNPSRASLWSGLRPPTHGVYGNSDDWSKKLAPGSTMPEHFMRHGYTTVRIGKMFHAGTRIEGGVRVNFDDTSRWSRIIEPNEGMPRVTKKSRPLQGQTDILQKNNELEAAGKKRIGVPFLYGPTGLDDMDMTDGRCAEQAIRVLNEEHDSPLFLAVGMHAPHLPFSTPDKYFDLYNPEDIVLPDVPDDDLDDTPETMYNDHKLTFHDKKKWREAVAAQYATVTYIDAQIGRILDALDKSGRADNTIVVVWSDHGFELGEHFQWRKGSQYQHSAQVIFGMRVPGLTVAGDVCQRPVETIDLYPTLCDLCGLPAPSNLETVSMKPLLERPDGPWKKGALVYGSNVTSIWTEKWRYSEYTRPEGARELYDLVNDPEEYTNVADDPANAEVVQQLSTLVNGGWQACVQE
jgi:iduronate 2-sulfatase